MPAIILASGSPRRIEILRNLGIPFTTSPQDIDESFAGSDPFEESQRLARKKLQALLFSLNGKPVWALAADTFIHFNGEFYGKPSDRGEAGRMLKAFSANEHSVVTGLAFCSPSLGITTEAAETRVTFAPLSPEEIDWYLDTGEWEDAAGAYRVQDRGAVLVDGINGSYSNVMGLPIRAFYGMLRQHNYPFGPPA